MKPRNVAALALVGWYLMVPPASDWMRWRQAVYDQEHHVRQQGGGAYSVFGFFAAPLSTWTRQGGFDSHTNCEKARQSLRSRKGTEVSQVPSTAIQYSADWAWCIATDDPRLKGN